VAQQRSLPGQPQRRPQPRLTRQRAIERRVDTWVDTLPLASADTVLNLALREARRQRLLAVSDSALGTEQHHPDGLVVGFDTRHQVVIHTHIAPYSA